MTVSPWVQGFAQGWGGYPGCPVLPPSPLSPQSAKLRLEGSVPYLQQGCCGCPWVCSAAAEEVGKDVTCNLSVSFSPQGLCLG